MFPQLGTASLTTYLTVWFCIAPMLVLCTCTEGHAAYAIQGHSEPACGHHDEDHSPATPHDHEDEQVQSDEWLTSNSNLNVLIFPTVCVGVIDDSQDPANTFHALDPGNHAHGPPEPVCASISSTILLI